MTEFKDKLKSLRKGRMMTRDELAHLLGVTASAIGMYERGKRMPKTPVLKDIAKLFNVDYAYLLEEEQTEQIIKDPVRYQYEQLAAHEPAPPQLDSRAVDEAFETARFLFENPEYAEIFKSIRAVDKDKLEFVKNIIDKLR